MAITRQINKLLQANGRDLEYMSLGFYCAMFEFKSAYRLSWRWLRGFWQACEFIEHKGDISKTTLLDYLGLSYTKGELPEVIAPFFFRDPATRRYTLSPAGIQAREEWTQTLRRVLHDEKERYRLLYERWNKEEVLKRKEAKRFYELAEEEQIRIARLFFSMPRATEADRRQVQAARKYLYLNFDVRPNDLKTLAKQYPAIQAAKYIIETDTTIDIETRFKRPEFYKKNN